MHKPTRSFALARTHQNIYFVVNFVAEESLDAFLAEDVDEEAAPLAAESTNLGFLIVFLHFCLLSRLPE